MASLDAPVSYRTDMARSRVAPASVICTFPPESTAMAPRGACIVSIFIKILLTGAGGPEAAGRPAPGQGAQRNCAVPTPISKWYLAMPRSTLV